jgi:carboxynorspermidine decarboxylase
MSFDDYQSIPSPAFVLDLERLEKNLFILHQVQEETGIKIILALKGFSLWHVFPLVKKYLSGATASSLHEVLLIFNEMGIKAHTYSPAYIPADFERISRHSHAITFNSCSEYIRYLPYMSSENALFSAGLRVNPGYSPVDTALYNPASIGSRLGVTPDRLAEIKQLPCLEGIHIHTLCESTSFHFEKLMEAVVMHFGELLPKLKWINFGGGHLITKTDYDIPHLISILKSFKAKFPNLQIVLEPGSAVVWETGELVSTVLDIVDNNGIKTAILDVSFTAHMPDTLEMPYRPNVLNASSNSSPTFPYKYRLGGVSCLAGDFLENYYFKEPLQIGQQLIFLDMMHYTMVKTTQFNGVAHPEIGFWSSKNGYTSWRKFDYLDFKHRLG